MASYIAICKHYTYTGAISLLLDANRCFSTYACTVANTPQGPPCTERSECFHSKQRPFTKLLYQFVPYT